MEKPTRHPSIAVEQRRSPLGDLSPTHDADGPAEQSVDAEMRSAAPRNAEAIAELPVRRNLGDTPPRSLAVSPAETTRGALLT
jgi:hypothetical protein